MKDLLNKIKSDKKNLGILVLGIILFLAIDFMFILKPINMVLKDVSKKVVDLRQKINNLAKDLETLKKESPIILKKSKRIIKEDELPALLRDISEVAKTNNLKINQIKPAIDFTKTDKSSPTECLITINLSGGYHQLGRFLANLENAPQFLSVEELKITARQDDYLLHIINLVLKTYIKK